MILRGTVTLTRALLEHMIWQQDMATRAAMVDLLLRANNKPGVITVNGARVEIKRGQLGWSKEALAKEWGCSVEKVDGLLRFLAGPAEFIRVETNRRTGTIITILNYDRYNPIFELEPASEPGTVTETKPDTEPTTEAESEPETNPGRKGKGDRKGEIGKGEERTIAIEIPSDADVCEFCANYTDLSRGISGIPEVWWKGWLAARMSGKTFPQDWRRVLKLNFESDWITRHPKAMAGVFKEKNGGASPAQRKFLIDQELAEVRARLESAHAIGVPPSDGDVARERELEKMAAT